MFHWHRMVRNLQLGHSQINSLLSTTRYNLPHKKSLAIRLLTRTSVRLRMGTLHVPRSVLKGLVVELGPMKPTNQRRLQSHTRGLLVKILHTAQFCDHLLRHAYGSVLQLTVCQSCLLYWKCHWQMSVYDCCPGRYNIRKLKFYCSPSFKGSTVCAYMVAKSSNPVKVAELIFSIRLLAATLQVEKISRWYI